MLDRPGIWSDEACTYGRVTGSYQQLLTILRDDGFAPLHYEWYWALKQWLVLTPVQMRLWPAFCGVLFVGACGWLAAEVVRMTRVPAATGSDELDDTRPAERRLSSSFVAIVLLLAATSAYVLYYSRDAKMYMPLWLCTTGCSAALLSALRTGRSRAWLLWIFFGVAATGIHTPAWLAIGVQPVALMLHPRRRWGACALWLVGAAVIAAGPAYHYLTFNQWSDHIEDRGWGASMLQWVDGYNEGRDLPQLARASATAWAFSWEWPDLRETRSGIAPKLLSAAEWTAIGVAALTALGALAWWIRSLYRTSPLPGWAGWYAVFWLLIPAYAVYCIGMETPLSLLDLRACPWWANAALGGVVLAILMGSRRPVRTLLVMVALALTALGIAGGIHVHHHYDIYPGHYSWHWSEIRWPSYMLRRYPREVHSVWMPRYLGTAFPAMLVLFAAGVVSLPGRFARWTATVAVVALNLGVFGWKLYIDPEPPVGIAMGEIFASDTPAATTLTFVSSYAGPGFEPGRGWVGGPVGTYYASIRLDPPVDPLDFRRFFRGPGYFSIRTRADRVGQEVAAREKSVGGPPIERIILWEQLAPTVDLNREVSADNIARRLGPLAGNFVRAPSQVWRGYDHWSGELTNVYRRIEWLRAPLPRAIVAPATQKAATKAASTRPG